MLTWLSTREERFSLIADLREGDAGAVPRLALSVAAGVALASAVLFACAMIEEAGRLAESHVAIGIGLAGVTWCTVLWWLWSTYERAVVPLRTAFMLIGLWIATFAISFLFAELFAEEEMFIGAAVIGSTAMTIGILTLGIYQWRKGRPVRTRGGVVQVMCPGCGYSLVGLSECTCPECGRHFTIDELISLQGYGGVPRRLAGATEADDDPDAEAAPAPAVDLDPIPTS